MKDLDFDELDRAVNSLMTNVPKSAPSSGDNTEKTLDITSTVKEGSQPSFDKIEQAATAAAAATPSTPVAADVSSDAVAKPNAAQPTAPRPSSVSQPATRRSGRFMDVVHPSSDMKKPEAPVTVSRQGSTIEPLKSATISEILPSKQDASTPPSTESPKEVKPAEKPEPISEPMPTPLEPSTAPSDWPDPLDLASANTPEEKDEMPAPGPTDGASVEPIEEEAPAPLTSPFLPDTKVEKRPLGAQVSDVPVEEPEQVTPSEEKESKTVDDPNDQLPADPTEIESPLPEELQGDLMAVEADTTHEQVKQAHDAATGSKPLEKQEKSDMPSPVSKPETSPVGESTAPSGPTSIPQQYHEEPSTGDQGNGAIYDTDAYHQPLAHPAKKKSGWMWVIWIVLILLVGAGGGAALYFLGVV